MLHLARSSRRNTTLPRVLVCHGLGGSNLDAAGQGNGGTFGQHALQSTIAAGYSLWAGENGGLDGWSTPTSQSDIDTLYTAAGNSPVLLVLLSMGAAAGLLWMSNNPTKVVGAVCLSPAANIQWSHDATDGLGNTGSDFSALIDGAWTNHAGFVSAQPTANPMVGTQLTNLQSQASKIHMIYGTSDTVINPAWTIANAASIGCGSTAVTGAGHALYDGTAWDDLLLVSKLDTFSGRSF